MDRAPRSGLGVQAQKQPGLSWVGLNVPMGRLDAASMAELAQLARRHGRWISESEQEDLQVQALQHSRERRKLLMLLVVAVLVPLFWPLVPVLAGLIWFPTTTRRLLFVLLLLGGFLILVLVTLQ